MFFLNLSAFEFFALLGTLSSAIAALYLLDRRKRKRVVSTLQFWGAAGAVEERHSKRHVQQPWSLLLQLLSLLLLLLAIADLHWGSRPGRSTDHVLLMDTSTWAGARLPGGTSVLDEEIRSARQYLRTLPPGDRVLLVSTDTLSRPAIVFTSDSSQWNAALANMHAGTSELRLDASLHFATEALRWSGESSGEIVYIGTARTGERTASLPSNFRVIKVAVPLENVGFRSAHVTGSSDASTSWHASFVVRNDGTQTREVKVQTGFAGTAFAPRMLKLRPGQESTVDYAFFTRTAGALKAILSSDGDALDSDNGVTIDLPNSTPVRVVAFTTRRAALEPLLSSDRQLDVRYSDPSTYTPPTHADLVIYDNFVPATRAGVPSLWLYPSREKSPLPVKTVIRNASSVLWNPESFGDAGLRTRDLHLKEAEVFQTAEGDTAVASLAEGPIAVLHDGTRTNAIRSIFIGYDLLAETVRSDLTTPLLVANALAWLVPDSFRTNYFAAEHTGTVTTPLLAGEMADSLHVYDSRGVAIPFALEKTNIQFFVDTPQVIKIRSGMRQRSLSLTLPEVSSVTWAPPSSVQTGVPGLGRLSGSSLALWQWLAAAGGIGLLLEWILFGQSRRRALAARRNPTSAPAMASAKAKEGVAV